MRKDLFKGVKYLIFFSIILILLASFVYAGIFEKLIGVPDLSPFFPDFSPFNATITVISNTAPIINISNEIFVCENKALSHYFNVTDEHSNLQSVSINPVSPFFVELTGAPNIGGITYNARIFSATLDKSSIDRALGYKIYPRTVSAVDIGGLVDTKPISITVIEVNNAPIVENIGVKTVWAQGHDSTFEHQVSVFDVEDGNQNSGNLTFNITFLNNSPKLFNISSNGTMFFTPNITDINQGKYNLSVYNISVCVKDRGIPNTHVNITNFCGQNGGLIENCLNFSLTITNENRAPIINSYYPINLSFNAGGINNLYFNITTSDPDGTIPDIYWYLDNTFRQFNSSSSYYEFFHVFGCGVSGEHNIKAEVTDGLLNSSLQWNISIQLVGCPSIPITGGGGGGSFEICKETWGCYDWNICQDVESSFESGLLAEKDYEVIKKNCKLDFFGDNCGLQIRGCIDVNACNASNSKPDEIEHCYFVENPGCSDRVKNCHGGECELLTDCGGPCNACPTCSDKIKNQGESGVDCEGPCPFICPIKPPILTILRTQSILVILISLFLLIIIIQIVRVIRSRKRIKV